MQKNEVIIQKFIETIKGSSVDKKPDLLLLDKVFNEIEKRKKRKFYFFGFLFIAFVLTGVGYMVINNNQEKNLLSSGKQTGASSGLIVKNEVKEQVTEVPDVPETKKSKGTTQKLNQKNTQQELGVISYKFDDHQIDVFRDGSADVIQINVFSSDGAETDILQIIEQLKKSYQNNQLSVDTVKP